MSEVVVPTSSYRYYLWTRASSCTPFFRRLPLTCWRRALFPRADLRPGSCFRRTRLLCGPGSWRCHALLPFLVLAVPGCGLSRSPPWSSGVRSRPGVNSRYQYAATLSLSDEPSPCSWTLAFSSASQSRAGIGPGLLSVHVSHSVWHFGAPFSRPFEPAGLQYGCRCARLSKDQHRPGGETRV